MPWGMHLGADLSAPARRYQGYGGHEGLIDAEPPAGGSAGMINTRSQPSAFSDDIEVLRQRLHELDRKCARLEDFAELERLQDNRNR